MEIEERPQVAVAEPVEGGVRVGGQYRFRVRQRGTAPSAGPADATASASPPSTPVTIVTSFMKHHRHRHHVPSRRKVHRRPSRLIVALEDDHTAPHSRSFRRPACFRMLIGCLDSWVLTKPTYDHRRLRTVSTPTNDHGCRASGCPGLAGEAGGRTR